MIRCVAFDFDGTLVLSNDIKRDAFFAAVSDYPDGREKMAKILQSNPGDRFEVFRRFSEAAGGDADELSACYGEWCEKRILSGPERLGASVALAQLLEAGIRVYVNSATPVSSLRSIVDQRYGAGIFAGVYGGFGAKVENLHSILRNERIPPMSLAMVGDGVDDHDAALNVGCRFVGVEGGTLEIAKPEMGLLHSLESLWPRLMAKTKDRILA